jgi:hypothetical protein
MYLLAAICMCPGVFIGIRGYKRFDPHNAHDPDLDTDTTDDDDPYVDISLSLCVMLID